MASSSTTASSEILTLLTESGGGKQKKTNVSISEHLAIQAHCIPLTVVTEKRKVYQYTNIHTHTHTHQHGGQYVCATAVPGGFYSPAGDLAERVSAD